MGGRALAECLKACDEAGYTSATEATEAPAQPAVVEPVLLLEAAKAHLAAQSECHFRERIKGYSELLQPELLHGMVSNSHHTH